MKRLIIVVLLILISSFAKADCYHNGVAYPTGSVVEGYVCTADGTWQKN